MARLENQLTITCHRENGGLDWDEEGEDHNLPIIPSHSLKHCNSAPGQNPIQASNQTGNSRGVGKIGEFLMIWLSSTPSCIDKIWQRLTTFSRTSTQTKQKTKHTHPLFLTCCLLVSFSSFLCLFAVGLLPVQSLGNNNMAAGHFRLTIDIYDLSHRCI